MIYMLDLRMTMAAAEQRATVERLEDRGFFAVTRALYMAVWQARDQARYDYLIKRYAR